MKAPEVAKKNNIVEINGKHYDADTGDAVHKPSTKTKPHAADKPVHEKVPFASPIKKAEESPGRPQLKTRSAMTFSRRMAEDLRHHPTEHAKTLMRAAVEKPKPSNKQLVRSRSGGIEVSQTSLIVPKQSAAVIDN